MTDENETDYSPLNALPPETKKLINQWAMDFGELCVAEFLAGDDEQQEAAISDIGNFVFELFDTMKSGG